MPAGQGVGMGKFEQIWARVAKVGMPGCVRLIGQRWMTWVVGGCGYACRSRGKCGQVWADMGKGGQRQAGLDGSD